MKQKLLLLSVMLLGMVLPHQTFADSFMQTTSNYTSMVMGIDKIQFTLATQYDGNANEGISEGHVYVTVDGGPKRKMEPTGIKIFDAYLQYLTAGGSDMLAFAQKYGLRRDDIDSMVFVLTGMRGVDFRMRYQVWIAELLLRYTNMSIAEVAKRSGFGSANNLYLTYKREFNIAPGYRRIAIRKQGDLGRFKL